MTKISDFIKPQLESLKITLTEKQLNQLDALAEAMLADPLYKSVSKIFEPEEMAVKHFLDSLIPLCYNHPVWKSKKIMDLGTGGGFPCLPLAIALPDAQFTAVDGRQKSVDFVARMAKAYASFGRHINYLRFLRSFSITFFQLPSHLLPIDILQRQEVIPAHAAVVPVASEKYFTE